MPHKEAPTVAVIEGDDAAPEAVRPSVELIKALAPSIRWVYPPVGAAALTMSGATFPEASRAIVDAADATFFGATSGASTAALKYLRWGLQTYANVRPFRYLPGARSPLKTPEGIDFVMVREGLEETYVCIEGPLEALADKELHSPTWDKPLSAFGEGRFALKAITRAGSERVIRFAFELARKRRGKLAVTAKYNMLPQSDGLFMAVARELGSGYPDVQVETYIVDDFAHRIIVDPHRFDVVVLPNLYGDILSDSAAALIGGLGMGPSGCYGDRHAYFEPSHGTAPDLLGQHVINPTATLLSGAMMLEYLGLVDEGRRLERAIADVYSEGRALTRDQGGNAGTAAFCEAVAKRLHA